MKYQISFINIFLCTSVELYLQVRKIYLILLAKEMIYMDFWQRHRIMFDESEFRKINQMVVFIAGAGGLGTHQVTELQRIGVKKIYLADYDRVDPTNLNRQILYGANDIERFKVKRAKEVLESFQLGTEIVALQKRITADTTIPDDVDLVFDALDNLEGRLELEKAAAQKGLPFIHGGVSSWYGQLTTIIPGKTKGLRDIFGQFKPPRGTIPAFSPLVSIVASLQVIEGVKVLLGYQDILVNKLLLIDSRNYSLEIIKLG